MKMKLITLSCLALGTLIACTETSTSGGVAATYLQEASGKVTLWDSSGLSGKRLHSINGTTVTTQLNSGRCFNAKVTAVKDKICFTYIDHPNPNIVAKGSCYNMMKTSNGYRALAGNGSNGRVYDVTITNQSKLACKN